MRLNAFTAIKTNSGSTFWHKVGSAWPNNNGNGYTVIFDSLPLPNDEGKVKVFLFEDGEKPTSEAFDLVEPIGTPEAFTPITPRTSFDPQAIYDLNDDIPF